MTKLFTVAFALLLPVFGHASSHYSVQCDSLAPFKKPIYLAGNDQLLQIKSLDVTLDEAGSFNVAMKVSGLHPSYWSLNPEN